MAEAVEPVAGPGGEPVSPDGKDGSAAPKESPRMTRLKQLAFDRRPSAILKAWAPKPKDDKPRVTKDPKDEALDKELSEFQKHVTLGELGRGQDVPRIPTRRGSNRRVPATASAACRQRPGMGGRARRPGGARAR